MDFQHFWIWGLMPVEFLGLFVTAFGAFLCCQRALGRVGYRVSGLWQAVLIWLAGFGILKFVSAGYLLPRSIMFHYVGVITVATFFYVASDDRLWAECKRSLSALFSGETKAYWVLRVLVFVTVPAWLGLAIHEAPTPKFENPIELRTHNPAPPRSIEVHGVRIDLQTAKNPFRVDEGLHPPAR